MSASDLLVNNYIIPAEKRYPTTPTLKINTDSISIYVTGSSSGVGYYCGSVFLKEKIDVSNFSKLKVTYKLAASYSNNWSNIALTNEIASNYAPIKNAGMDPSSAGGLNVIAVSEMDVSDMSGKYYLAFLAATPYISNNSQNATTYIYKIELLK